MRPEKRNVTLSVPVDLLKRVKYLAVQRETSMSQLVLDALAQLVQQEDTYEASRRRARRQLQETVDRGTERPYAWSRSELHDRHP